MSSTETPQRIEDPNLLIETIAAALTSPAHTFVEVVPGDAPDVEERIAFVRSCGRKAGRGAGLSVKTAATDAEGMLRVGSLVIATRREDGGREVHVMATGKLG